MSNYINLKYKRIDVLDINGEVRTFMNATISKFQNTYTIESTNEIAWINNDKIIGIFAQGVDDE